jgi:micrococcal nuclease
MVDWGKAARRLVPLLAFFSIIIGFEALSGGILPFIGGVIYIAVGLFYFKSIREFVSKKLNEEYEDLDLSLHEIGSNAVILILIFGMFTGAVVMGQSQPSPEATTPPETTQTDVTDQPSSDDSADKTTTGSSSDGTTNEQTSDGPTTDGPTTEDSGSQETGTDWSLSTGVTVEVVSITDGDTMDVRLPNGSVETVRLLGVDTPETSVTQVTPDEWGFQDTTESRDWLANWGGEATTYAEDRIGEEVYIQTDSEADRRGYYGRLLVYVYQSESASTSFNKRLLSDGYARYYSSEFSKQTEFRSTVSDAKQSEEGVWGYTEPTDSGTDDSQSSDSGSGEGDLEVVGIHADADGNDHDNLNDEYITFENTGGASLDMGGWTISDSADHTYSVPSGFNLDAGERLTLYTGSGSDSDTELYWGSSSAIWNNSGDTITVETDGEETVIEYEYN